MAPASVAPRRLSLASLGFLFYAAASVQAAGAFVGQMFPGFTSAVQVATNGAVISLAIWALLETQKTATAEAVWKLLRSRWLWGASIVGSLAVVSSFWLHAVHIQCGQDAMLGHWQGADGDVFRCTRGQVRLRWAVGSPWQTLTISEGRDHFGRRAAVTLGMLQAVTFRYPADFAPPPFALVFPDEDVLVMTPQSNPSAFTVGVAGSTERVALTAAGVLLGASAVPESARAYLKSGDPRPLRVALRNGEPLELLTFYKDKPCTPLRIDPAEKPTWTLSYASCRH